MGAVGEALIVDVEVDIVVVVTTVNLLMEDWAAEDEAANEDAASEELAGEEVVGVVNMEIIPLPLTGYCQHTFDFGLTCKRTLVQEGIAEGLVEKAKI